MKLLVPLICAGALAACGQPAQQQASQEPYSAPSSPDATGQPGYSENPTQWDQVQGEATGRGSAATGASEPGQNLGNLPAGDTNANTGQQPQEQAP